MKKEDVLKKYKAEGIDEGQEYRNERGDEAGFFGLLFLSLALMIYQSWRGLPFGDISAVLFCFLSVGMFYRYKLDGDKTKLALGILTGIACLAALGWYVWKTL